MERIPLTELVKKLLKEDYESSLQKEEMIHMLLKDTTSTIEEESETYGQYLADKMAEIAGSWSFIVVFAGILAIWIGLNVYILANAFDPYPFILLNLALSCLSALQAPIIMMSQNRQAMKDRKQSENEYKVNLKAEIIVEDLHYKIDEILLNQNICKSELEKIRCSTKR